MGKVERLKEEVEAAPGAPVWVVSFCDMSQLLLCFFIMLLAASSQTISAEEDILKILATIKVGFGYRPNAESKDPVDLAILQLLAQKKNQGRMDANFHWTPPAIRGKAQKDPELLAKQRGPVGSPMYFAPNSTLLSLKAQVELDNIASMLRVHQRTVVIEGHCSQKEARRDKASGGYELAFRRAVAIKRELVNRGVPASRLRLVSCGAFEADETQPEALQRQAFVTLGTYYLPGGNEETFD